MRDEQLIQSMIDGRPAILHNGEWHILPSGGDGTPVDPERPEGEGEGEGGEQPQPEQPAEGEPEAVAPEVPELLDDVDDDALRELHANLSAYRTTARERQDVEGVRNTFAQQQRIAETLTARNAERQRVAQELSELDAMEEPALPEREPALAGAGASAAQLANVRVGQTREQQQPPAPAVQRPRVALLGSAGTEVVPAGTEMSMEQLGSAIDRAKRGRAGQTILASIPSFEEAPEGMPAILSDRNGATVNDELIREAVADWDARVHGREPVQAAARQGAICEPYDIIREIPEAFRTDTPVANIFPSRPAGRGGFMFTPSGTLADVDGAVSQWNEADQAAVDPDDSSTWKPCIDYDCPDTQTAVLEAITQCVTFDITLEMSNPERVRNLNAALSALVARTYEGRLLERIDQLSHPFVFSGDYGALPAVIEAINSLVPQLNFTNRERAGEYVLIVPPAVAQILTIDRANRAYGVEAETSDVMAYLRGNLEGVRSVVSSLDASLGGEPGIPFPALPPVGGQANAGAIPYISGGVYRLRLVDPAAAIFAETGEMNAGTLRDANLTRQNKVGYFAERFFFLAKHGPQPWATIDIHLCADGARAGLVDPSGCLAS